MTAAHIITGMHLRAARAWLGMSQAVLAEQAGVSLPTLKRAENGDLENTTLSILRKLVEALEKAGIEFLPEGIRGCAPSESP